MMHIQVSNDTNIENVTPTFIQTLYDDNEVTIKYLGLTKDSRKTLVNVYIENNTNRDVCVQVENLAINDFMISSIFSSEVASGKKIIDDIDIYNTNLDKSGITDIKTIDLSLNIFDWDDSKYRITTKPVKIKTE